MKNKLRVFLDSFLFGTPALTQSFMNANPTYGWTNHLRLTISQNAHPNRAANFTLVSRGVCYIHLRNIFTSSHLLILYLHTFSSSRLLIFTSSHLHIFTSSHLHTFSSSHLLIFTPSHLHTFSSSHLLIFTSSHLHIFSSSHLLSLALLPSCPLLSPSFLFLS